MNTQSLLGAVSVVMCLAVTSTPLMAQEGTDFSGQWVLISERGPNTPVALMVEQTVARKNVRGESIKPVFKDITVVREFSGGRQSETYPIGGVSGTVPGGSVIGGRANEPNEPYTHLAVNWARATLVIATGHHTGRVPETGVWAERLETWSLDPEGKLHIVVSTRSSTDIARILELIYRRQ